MTRPGRHRSKDRVGRAVGVLATTLALCCGGGTAVAAPDCPPVSQAPTPAALQVAQRNARDRGFLWRITRDGHSSYLYGTLHVGKLEWVFPGSTVRRALLEADTLALELDISDPATLQTIAAGTAADPQSPALPPALETRLAQQMTAACVAPAALAPQHPLMRAVTLSMLAARRAGLEPAFGQETMLASTARARQMPIVALETVTLQLASLIPRDPALALDMLDQTLAQIETGAAQRGAARLATSWATGRLDELAHYERWCECVATEQDRAALRRLNDDRNPAMADRIASLHADGRRLFAAVGALHMTGPNALPALMAARGFSVDRIRFTH